MAELRSSLATGTAVFIAGGVLLGPEIASSRPRTALRQLAVRLGPADRDRLVGLDGYWIGGIVADRYPEPSPPSSFCLAAASLPMVLAIPFVDGWILDRVVEWDPGPRLNPVIATILPSASPASSSAACRRSLCA